MTAPSRLARVGIGREGTFGDGTAPSLLVAVDPPKPVDNNPPLFDSSWRGSAAAVSGQEPGPLDGQVSLSGPVHADTVGFFLAGLLGDLAFTSGSPNTWVMSLLNSGLQQPNSYAVWVDDPVGPLLYAGGRVSQASLTFDPTGLLTWAAALSTLTATVPGTVNIPAESGESVLPGWATSAQVGGVTDVTLLSAQVQLARAATAKRNVTGEQNPWTFWADVLDVTGTLAFAVRTDTLRADFTAGTSTSLDLNCAHGGRQLKVHCSDVVLTAAARTYGQRWVELTCGWRAIANTSDAGGSGGKSPVQVTLTNTVPNGTY